MNIKDVPTPAAPQAAPVDAQQHRSLHRLNAAFEADGLSAATQPSDARSQQAADSLHAAIMNLLALPEDEQRWTVYGYTKNHMRDAYRAGHRDARHAAAELVAAQQAPVAGEPTGWKLVPLEPTQAMIDAWCVASPEETTDESGAATTDWRAMLAAAPTPTAASLHQVAPSDASGAMQQALAALEVASTGLAWFRDTHPESVDASDGEADEAIDAAVARLTAALASPALPVLGDADSLDAKRYRWLRDQCGKQALTIACLKDFDLVSWAGDQPDAAIDAAIAQQEKNNDA